MKKIQDIKHTAELRKVSLKNIYFYLSEWLDFFINQGVKLQTKLESWSF